MMCPHSGLDKETLEYIMQNYNLARRCWELVRDFSGISHHEIGNLMVGQWIINHEKAGRDKN